MCSVYLYKQRREVDFPINIIQLVTPQKQGKVITTVYIVGVILCNIPNLIILKYIIFGYCQEFFNAVISYIILCVYRII